MCRSIDGSIDRQITDRELHDAVGCHTSDVLEQKLAIDSVGSFCSGGKKELLHRPREAIEVAILATAPPHDSPQLL